MDLGDLGRWMLVAAAVLAATGLLFIGASALGLGRLPGDVVFRRGNLRVYVPLATMIIISVIATVVLNLFFRR